MGGGERVRCVIEKVNVSLWREGSLDYPRYLRAKFVGKEDRFSRGRSLQYTVRSGDPSHFENHPRAVVLFLSHFLSHSLPPPRPLRRAGNEKETSRTLILQRRDISRPGVHDEICIKRDFADFVFRRVLPSALLSSCPLLSSFLSSTNLDDTSLSAPGLLQPPAFFTLHTTPRRRL